MEITSIVFPLLSIGGLGLAFGFGLGYADKKFKVEEDERIPLIRDVLPGANCGGCGFPGCDGFAAAVVSGSAKVTGCPVGGHNTALKIAEILGVEASAEERHVAYIKCNGNLDNAKSNYKYIGIMDCKAAATLSGGGSKGCAYGCLGLGSCKNACQFNAISIENGVAKVDNKKCTACGMCVTQCPKNLIELIPSKSDVKVSCNSRDKGKDVKANCIVGCIGCKICERACSYGAIHVSDLLAKIDYDKCTLCNECIEKCPTKAIIGLIQEV